MKKFLLMFLVLLPVLLVSQEDTNDGFQMGGSAGAMTINGETYTRIRLNPEFVFWKFGVGLDFDLLITGEGDLREEDWDDPEDYINKILYIRYGHRGDPFYAKVGSMKSYTLANGLIMSGYSNMLQYPDVRKIGGYFGINTEISGLGLEVFDADFAENDIFAGRVFLDPFQVTQAPLFKNLQLGASFAIDTDQYNRFNDEDGDNVPDIFDAFEDDSNYSVDTDGDGIPDEEDIDADGDNLIDNPDDGTEWWGQLPESYQDNDGVNLDKASKYDAEDEVVIFGLDYTLPIIDEEYLKLYHYSEYAKILDYGQGVIFPGFGAKIAIFDFKLEGRRFEDEFIPGYFDYQYDTQRSYVSGDTIITKESILEEVKASTGWYGSVTANIANVIYFDLAYQDMYGDDVTTGKSLWAGLRADTSMIPKIKEASIEYSQTNKRYINFSEFRNPNAVVNGKISYELSPSSFLVGNYKERYTDINNDGKIKGTDEIEKTFGFGVEFNF